MTKIKYLTLTACVLLALGACSGEGAGNDIPSPSPTPSERLPIHVCTVMGSRATDDAFENGDRIGLFVVNHDANGSAMTLQATSNHIDNSQFTYQNGTWTSATPTYWKDETTHADFYIYYPYTASIQNVEAMPWNVKEDQSQVADYKASDLLIGRAADITPTASAVPIDAQHAMSQMVITLVAGNGFTESSLSSGNISVKVNQLKTHATVNLATGTVTPTGGNSAVIPLKVSGKYKALVIPQTVEDGNLITVTADGRSYNLPKANNFTAFEAGKSHQFTVTLSKTNNGMNVSITKWEDDGIDHGGTAE